MASMISWEALEKCIAIAEASHQTSLLMDLRKRPAEAKKHKLVASTDLAKHLQEQAHQQHAELLRQRQEKKEHDLALQKSRCRATP